jgi:hypothetical protein
VGGWLVGDHERRVEGQRSGDSDALLLASGELPWSPVDAVAEAHRFEQRDGSLSGLSFGGTGAAQWYGDVFGRGEALDEVERLEDDADPAAVFIEAATIEGLDGYIVVVDRAARRSPQPSKTRQKCGLAASARTEDQKHRSGVNGERHVVQSAEHLAASREVDG